MNRTTVAAVLAALVVVPVARACTAPYEPMPHNVYGKGAKIIIREGTCVVDPGWWISWEFPKSSWARVV